MFVLRAIAARVLIVELEIARKASPNVYQTLHRAIVHLRLDRMCVVPGLRIPDDAAMPGTMRMVV